MAMSVMSTVAVIMTVTAMSVRVGHRDFAPLVAAAGELDAAAEEHQAEQRGHVDLRRFLLLVLGHEDFHEAEGRIHAVVDFHVALVVGFVNRAAAQRWLHGIIWPEPPVITPGDYATHSAPSDAIVLFPGGFGTMDEGYEAITLMQTGKSQLMPLVLVDKPGGTYWKTWDKQIREHLLRDELISPDDLNLYQITDSTDEAVKIITRFYRNFHSTCFVKDLLIIRVKHAPSATAIEALNEDFGDILAEGGAPFRVIPPTEEEVADKDRLELPRVAFGFNRRDYGRLRQVIDVLNRL